MKLKQLKIENFRSYREETVIDMDDMTAFVGKNDIGKSSILEALDIFFNEGSGSVKMDADDVHKSESESGKSEIVISVVFSDFPDEVIIDDSYKTSFADEYLLNAKGDLEIVKKYPKGGKAKVFIKANHPGNSKCADLLSKKQDDLKKVIKKHEIECDNKAINAVLRRAIWNHFANDLQLQQQEIDVSKEDAKNIWEKISKYLPIYFLFQSDRKNTDGDSEVQDPLKASLQQILQRDSIREKLDTVADEVKQGLTELSGLTLEKLKAINPDLAGKLHPELPETSKLKWENVFKVSIFGDDEIPINKRGSGVKRLVLLSFFQAEAERKMREEKSKTGHQNSVIYAIEEPETSQHFEHQKILMDSLKELAKSPSAQVLLTTHNAIIVKQLDHKSVRLIAEEDGKKTVSLVKNVSLPYPSMNEINYTAFGEATEEYHNELYGYIESKGTKIKDFRDFQKEDMLYERILKNGDITSENRCLSHYIRDQIHHPENKCNERFIYEQLEKSIADMRTFIAANMPNEDVKKETKP